MKKALATIVGLSMMLSVASCSKKVEVPSKSDVKKAAAEEYDMEFTVEEEDISDDEKDAEWLLISKDGTLEVTVSWNSKDNEFEFDDEQIEVTVETVEETTSETAVEETTAETTVEETTAASESSNAAVAATDGNWVNFDEMNFYINGTKFTLGKTTLQDMIDAGVPFRDTSLEKATEDLEADYQSSAFYIDLGEYSSVQVKVLNYSDSTMPANECVINQVYFPIDTDQTSLTFDFPLTMTFDELIAKYGEPEDGVSHYDGDDGYYTDTVKYERDSEIYYRGSSYKFEFTKGELDYFSMEWMP